MEHCDIDIYTLSIDDYIEDEPESKVDTDGLYVFSRDWTIESVVGQIEKGNIDLTPSFQRRNVWSDEKRSGLIESIILDLPIPEIVLAEHPAERKKYIVIDGKQRLLSISGFVLQHSFSNIWNNHGRLQKLRVLCECNGCNYEKLESKFPDYARMLDNGTVRCTVISGYKDEDVLYEIFHRLNTGSVPLSTQELRNVLHKGKFNEFLFKVTEKENPLRHVLNINCPDRRLRDIEMLVRIISFRFFSQDYNGNLKKFLDDSTKAFNASWSNFENQVKECVDQVFNTLSKLKEIFGGYNYIGRKYTGDKFESRFNRALFEAQVLTFMQVDPKLSESGNTTYLDLYKSEMCSNPNFRSSVEATTKTVLSYHERFESLSIILSTAYGTIHYNPFKR